MDNQQHEEAAPAAAGESFLTTLGRQSVLLKSILDHLAYEVTPAPSENPPVPAVNPVTEEEKPTMDMLAASISSKPSTVYCTKQEQGDLLEIKPSGSTESGITTSTANTLITTTRDEELANSDKPPSTATPPPTTRKPVCALWTRLTEDGLNQWLRHLVVTLGTYAARHPWAICWAVAFLSFGLAGIGMATNLTMVFDHETIFTPTNSLPAQHGAWLSDATQSGFTETADMLLIVHAEDGSNVLQVESVRRVFQALDTLRTTPGYDELCAQSSYINPYNSKEHTCWIWSVTQFWEHDSATFEESYDNLLKINAYSYADAELVHLLSQPAFPDGVPVFHEILMGSYERANQSFPEVVAEFLEQGLTKEHTPFTTAPPAAVNDNNNLPLLTSAPAYIISVGLPVVTEETELFQERALERLKQLQDTWMDQSPIENPQNLRLQFFCQYAYLLEYERALLKDMPLALVVFAVMLTFTMVVFHHYGLQRGSDSGKSQQRQPLWKSRASLGVASVVTIGASLMSGFGLMFCLGVPFTNITQMVPFIILGVGLDDTFIITGAYFRRMREFHQQKDAAASLQQTSEEIRTKPLLAAHYDTQGQIIIVKDEDDDTATTASELSAGRQREEERVVQRIHDTLQEVGLSISLTTMTTTFAFILGCISSIPGIRWLCLYASATIVFDFVFQITLFVALMVLDERRVSGTLLTDQDGEYPRWFQCLLSKCCCCFKCCCCCCGFGHGNRDEDSLEQADQFEKELIQEDEKAFFMDRFMKWYAAKLMKPVVKVIVIVVFLVMFGLNVWSTTALEQQFNIEGTKHLAGLRKACKNRFGCLLTHPFLCSCRLRFKR